MSRQSAAALHAVPVSSSTAAAAPLVHVEAISPEVALAYLEQNIHNRNVRQARVNRYAADMRNGVWHITNDAVTFATDGTLLNGQHRLWAVVESGVTVEMLVLRGARPESMAAMDTGAARTAGDYFGKAGLKEQHPALLAAAIKQIILLDTGRVSADRSGQEITNFQMEDWLDEHPQVRASVASAMRFARLDATPRVRAVSHYYIAERNGVELADYFFGQIISRAGEPEGSAVHAIDSRLREVRRARAQYEAKYLISLILRGWNKYAVDGRIRTLPILDKGAFRLPEVEKWRRADR